MKFKINGNTWEISTISNKEIDNIEGNNGENFIHGTTRYGLNKIFINEDTPEQLRTLKHELVHVWLHEYGHRPDEKRYNEEDICEIVASSNDFINEVVNKYFGIEPLYLCNKDKNTECNKKYCGKECNYTSNIEFAKTK